jgi:hypothetical protein
LWKTDQLNVHFIDNPQIQGERLTSLKNTFFSTEQTTYGGFIGWQGGLDRINDAHELNNVPDRFVQVQNPFLADIIVEFSNEPDPENPNRGGLALTKSLPSTKETIAVEITIYDADDKGIEVISSILRHEIGHALGLDHTERFNDLMSPTIIFNMKTISNHNVDTLYTIYR